MRLPGGDWNDLDPMFTTSLARHRRTDCAKKVGAGHLTSKRGMCQARTTQSDRKRRMNEESARKEA